MRNLSSLVLFVSAVTAASAAGPDAKYKAPRHENGQPGLQGMWNFSSDVPLERPASAGGKGVWTREERDAQKAATRRAFDTLARVAPIEAVALTVLDFEGLTEDLRTSLITYPENGRLPKLVDGVRRLPGPEQLLAALANPGSPALAQFAAFFSGGKKDGAEDLSTGDRCLLGGGAPLTPGFDGNYVHIIQAKDAVALVTENETRIVPLDGRPHVSEKLRSWGGDSRGRWEGDTLVIETRNFNRRTPSFSGAGNSLDKLITERLTRVSTSALQYEATIVDAKTFQDKVVFSLPMTKVESRIYEYACHEGNYSLPMILAGARKDEREGNVAGPPPPRLQQIALVDRQGKAVSTVAEPGVYSQPALSPDGARVAVIRTDPDTRDTDVWVYDVATGKGTPVTRDAAPNRSPVWSPDGGQIAYVTVNLDDNYNALFRKASDGSGREELLHTHPTGAAIVPTDWSPDGVICFWSEKVTYALPLEGRKAIALSDGTFNVRGARFSPDGRLIAYASDESGRFQVYARPFSLASIAESPAAKGSPVSSGQAIGGIFWRQDGKEMFFLNSPEQTVMAVDVTMSPSFTAGTPRRLFKLPNGVPGPAQLSNVATRDGQRFVFLVQTSAPR